MRLALLALLGLCTCTAVPVTPAALAPVAADTTAFVERQLREQRIPGACVAVLDVDPETGVERRWTAGFGSFRGGASPMPHDATHRVASISKLFTDTAAMVLVERGLLDLDAPITRVLPELAPENPFGGDVTLRQLMAHRAGLVREGPVGHYFDPSEPSLAATVASLNDTALVHAPGTEFKYSNPGIGVVGEMVARVTQQPFEDAARELVLAPLGLRDSDFAARPDLVERQAHGVMWTYDGRTIPTPDFAFGYGPAANLRSTAADLVTFARSWFPDATTRVLSPDAQAAMWDGTEHGCALGFFVRPFDGERMVGHDGAVYGFASALRALPDQRLAVAVVCTKDFATEIAEAIAERALRGALAARRGDTLPPPVYPLPLGVERARTLAGHYQVGRDWVELHERGGELIYVPNVGVCTRLRVAADGSFVSDDTMSLGGRRLTTLPDGKLYDGKEEYVRDDGKPAAPPPELLELIGEYGWDHDVLIVYEDRGDLAVLIEWVVRDVPERVGKDHYRFNPGMYTGDQLRFERDAAGKIAAVLVGGARFQRRPDPGASFRIVPQHDVAELIAAAATAAPPAAAGSDVAASRAPDLVELQALEPGLRVELKYATADNFLGTPVYPRTAKAKMQRHAAEALARVHRALAARGFGLFVFDAYRPWSVTKVFWDATPRHLKHFVADPMRGSRHNRGCAVDLTLFDLATGKAVEMPSGYDEFTPRAYPDYPGGTTAQRWHRELLRRAMEGEGFAVYEHEWWHFDFGDWAAWPIGNEPL